FPEGLRTRREFLAVGALATLVAPLLPNLRSATISAGELPIEQAFGREMKQFMTERRIPGGALAVVKDRRLVFVCGYGWADCEQKLAVKPESLFRIASISKPITAVAILRLVEAGKLDLDAPVVEVMGFEPKA